MILYDLHVCHCLHFSPFHSVRLLDAENLGSNPQDCQMSNDFPEFADLTEFRMFRQVFGVEFEDVKGCSGCMRIIHGHHRSIEA